MNASVAARLSIWYHISTFEGQKYDAVAVFPLYILNRKAEDWYRLAEALALVGSILG